MADDDDDWVDQAADKQLHNETVERDFQQGIRSTPWYKEYVERYGEEPDLNTPHYDYRRAWASGARPNVRDPSDKDALHWPSEFKGESHPNRFVDGIDTKKAR